MNNKIYITTEGTRVTFTHFMPFDAKDGLHKSADELSQTGYLIDSNIPQPENKPGKVAEAHYTSEKGYYYEYIDAPQQPTATASIEQNMQLIKSVQDGVITPKQFKQITGVEYTL